ncbi:MAG: carboxypeptidase-like regulatory domain-containing protein [Aphanocapsa lilacina HA4352-LM1]|jgi:hypothetical protein|nr:carboxypeptidase-like regulatory domain-containing protein [Aphanocapsa lilacina HA4352-LM1]
MFRTLFFLALLALPPGAALAAEAGDIDGDGRVDAGDIQAIDAYLEGAVVLQDSQIASADADGDGKITRRDRDLLKRRVDGVALKGEARVGDGGGSKIDLTSADSGVVTDKETGRPLAGVDVSLPDEGITVRTDSEGRFKLPKATGGKILTAKANNYAPFSLSAATGSPGGGFNLELERLSPRLQVIDDELHHLGDDRFGSGSANATDFRLRAEGIAYVRTFTLKNQPTGDMTLRIGSVIGLDTPQSAAAGQTQVAFFGTEQDGLRVYLNGNMIKQIYVNGDNIPIKLPRWLLNSGKNELRIETHAFNQPAFMSAGGLAGLLGAFGIGGMGMLAGSGIVDHDDIEFAHLVLEDSAGRSQEFGSRGRVYGGETPRGGEVYTPQVRP